MATGHVFPDDYCYISKSEECRYEPPETLPSLLGAWRLFELTSECSVRAGVDGVAVAPAWSEIEAAAQALGEPWDGETIERYLTLWYAQQDARAKTKPKS